MSDRQAIYERDGYCCLECGVTQAEHVSLYQCSLGIHQINPTGGYALDNGMTLCCVCHSQKAKARNPPWLRTAGAVHLKLTDEELMFLDVVRKDLQARLGATISRQDAVMMAIQYYIEKERLFDGETQRKRAAEKRKNASGQAGATSSEPCETASNCSEERSTDEPVCQGTG